MSRKAEFAAHVKSHEDWPRDLQKYHQFILDKSLRNVRNREVHEDYWKTFAFAVFEGAKQAGGSVFRDIEKEHAASFLFTYGMTWKAAAAKAREGVE